MLVFVLVAGLLALASMLIAGRVKGQRRIKRRQTRRARSKVYTGLWNHLMVRPRVKRLAVLSVSEPTNIDAG